LEIDVPHEEGHATNNEDRCVKQLWDEFSGIMQKKDLIGGIRVPRLTHGLTVDEKHSE